MCRHPKLILVSPNVRDSGEHEVSRCLDCGHTQLNLVPTQEEDYKFYDENLQDKNINNIRSIKKAMKNIIPSFATKLYFIYQLAPFLRYKADIKNRYGLVISIFLGKSKFKIKLRNDQIITFNEGQDITLLNLLRLLRLSSSYNIHKDGKIDFSLDSENTFTLNLKNISYEDQNLLNLLVWAHLHGGNVIKSNDKTTLRNKRTLKIIDMNGEKIIETYNGVKFYLDSFVGGVIESFIQNIHVVKEEENWKDKIVVDVGASVGDTPLYFAGMGAKVYAFELTKENYDAMIRNIELNPQLSDRIIPIHAGIGKDGIIEYYKDPIKRYGREGGVSVFTPDKVDNTEFIKETVQGYTLSAAFNKFNILHADLLKMDCKGCEFSESSLTEEVLKKVNSVKIEYLKAKKEHSVDKLLAILKKSGFVCRLYKNATLEITSFNEAGNIYAEKI